MGERTKADARLAPQIVQYGAVKHIKPGPGQESVWDYPRPPALERMSQHVKVELNGVVIANTHSAFRVLETSHPPGYYIDPADVDASCFESVEGTTVCEYKGVAQYYDLVVGDVRRERAAWYYPRPTPAFALAGFVSIYPSRVDACWVNGERVQPQGGDFYGGWITDNIVGPFKGGPGTWGW